MKISSLLFSFVFGAMFAGAGTFILWQTSVPMFQSWRAMQDWRVSTAQLIDIRGAANDTKATYRYRVDDQEFNNDRVYVAAFKDNIGSYHKRLFDRLAQLKNEHQPVPIWYNPNNPEASVIDRSMRWGLFALTTGFCAVFIVIGLAAWFFGVKTVRRNSSDRHLKLNTGPVDASSQPSSVKPWLENKYWQTERIRSSAKIGMFGMWVFAVFWNAVSLPLLFILEDEIKAENYAVLIAILFPLVGVYLIFLAWRMTREWLRFGVVELIMDPFPGAIGGNVGGSLTLKQVGYRDARFRVGLECVYSFVSGSGKSRSRKETIHWAEAGDAKTGISGDGVRLEFLFDVPDDLPEADIKPSGNYNFWRLKLTGNLPGVDLNREYKIPVFRTGEQSRFARHSISAQVDAVRQDKAVESQAAIDRGDWESTALSEVIRIKQQGHWLRLYFPMFRKKLLTLFALIFGVGFSFATYAMNQTIGGGAFAVVILIFSIPFALVGLFGSIATIYLLFNNLSVSIGQGQIDVLRRLFIFPISRTKVSADKVAKMEIKSSGSTGQGINKVKHYKIVLSTIDNKKITVAEDIDGEDLANQFKEFLYQRLIA